MRSNECQFARTGQLALSCDRVSRRSVVGPILKIIPWVIGGVERSVERRVFAEIVEKRDAATLVDVVRRRVAPGSG